MNVLERIRPQEGNDIREMPTGELKRKVVFYFGIALLAAIAWIVTTPGTWAYSISLVGTVFMLAVATPGAIELHARAGDAE